MNVLILYDCARRIIYLIQRQGILFKKVKEKNTQRYFIENTCLCPQSSFSLAAIDYPFVQTFKEKTKYPKI